MADENTTALLAKIARMEEELSTLRKTSTTAFDKRAFVSDPLSAMEKLGIDKHHVARFLIADQLGDKADPAIRTYAQLGPQIAQTESLKSELEALRRVVEDQQTELRRASVAQSLKSNTDKSKHPYLAAALARDPDLFKAEIEAHRGDAAALAESLEGRLAATAKALGHTLPADSSKTSDESTQESSKPALAGSLGGDPPTPSQASTSGGWSAEDHQKLKAEIIRKYAPQTT
jgi:hypothetical protein